MSSLRDVPLEEPGEVEVQEPSEIPEGMRMCSDGVLRPKGRLFGEEGYQPPTRTKGLAKRIREMVGDDPARIANVLFDILEDPKEKSSDRISAAREILDRGWGKAPSYAPIESSDPLEANELDKAIRDIADQLISRRAHPSLDAELVRREIAEGVRPELGSL